VVFNALRAHDELTPYPSEANFILFRVPHGRADDIFYGLQANGVLIKNLNKPFGPLADCLRVTIGTPQENEKFLYALERALEHH
jgi:histidinol-phosphate aminotransferase